ncbi:ABC transporter substrate-binding protein [Trueperella pecoris]|uniref:Extracellular solute-binding protein n=1 Tax=Trueperella pecoris TaxID=2733571 RepID=A0A7M1QV59_9ACTO|nr:extracellular solute-binding protein [Trueperella pecoris]QOQ39627.1 extracellular solute-binding protein [Trueperella pecoris]QOR45746.1 extracellular solute-binding protein [Trueperella pecoris]
MTKMSSVAKLGAIFASGALILSACSTGTKSADTKTPSTTSSTTANSAVSIEYLHRLPDGEGMTPVSKIVERWNAEHPNIQVKATKFDGKAQDLIKKVQTDTAAGNAACLYQAGYADLAELYVGGLVQDVTEHAKQYASKFGEGPFKSMALDGKFFGLPQDTGPLVYYYNKAAFEALGLKVPTTAQEFVDTAKKAAEKGKYIVTFQTDEAGSLFPALSAAAGDQWFGIDGEAWTVSVEGKGTKAVADFYQQLLDAKAAPVVERWGTDWGTKLNDGTIIGTIGAAWEAPLLAGDMADSDNVGKWAVAQLPDFGSGMATGPDGGSGVVVSKTCAFPKEAMEFNAWFNTQVNDLASQGLVVAASDQPTAPKYAEFYGGQDVLAEFAKANDAMKAFTFIPGWSAVWGALGENSAATGNGSKTVTDLLTKAGETAKEAITNAGLKVK